MYSKAASLNSVTEQGATTLSSWHTLRVVTELVSLVGLEIHEATYQIVPIPSDISVPAGLASTH